MKFDRVFLDYFWMPDSVAWLNRSYMVSTPSCLLELWRCQLWKLEKTVAGAARRLSPGTSSCRCLVQCK